jgi:hypothetical protein
MTLSFLFHPERAARLVQQKALDGNLPGLTDVIERVSENVFGIRFRDGYPTEVNRAVERVLVDRLLLLASHAPMAQVRAESAMALRRLRERVMAGSGTPDWPQDAHYELLTEDIRRFLERPHESVANPAPLGTPPGSPIGEPALRWIEWDWAASSSPWGNYDWWWQD